MKKRFFIHDGTEQTGPFTIDEIGQKGITAKTMIWFEGIQTWTEAQFIPEMKEIITKTPPPFIKPAAETKDESGPPPESSPQPVLPKESVGLLNRKSLLIGGAVALIIIIIGSLLLYNKQGVVWGSDLQVREKFLTDSISQAYQASMTEKQNLENNKNSLKKTIETLKAKELFLSQKYQKLQRNLSYANSQMSEVCEFHFLRTYSEREAQIQMASMQISKIQQQLVDLKEQYYLVQNNLTAAKEKLASLE